MRQLTEHQKHMLATLGVFASTGIVDLAWHGGPWGAFGVGAATIITGFGGDIAYHAAKNLVMGTEVEKIDEAIRTSVLPEDMHEDQRTWSKIKRLTGLGEGTHQMPKESDVDTIESQGQEPESIVPLERPQRTMQKPIQQSPRQFKETTVKPVFSIYPGDETLKLGYVVETGARFDPHIDMLFGQGMIASAVQGAGKSMLTGVVIEQAAKCGVPIVIFDHKGEYAPIADLPFVNGIRAGSAVLRAKLGPECFELTDNNAAEFVQMVMSPDENGYYSQGIIHLPSYGDEWLSKASIVAAVGKALMQRSVQLREQEIEPIPCLVLMDEAQLYVPQNIELLPPEAKVDKVILNSLSNSYFSLVSNGRSNGYTVLFATPSLTYIAKWAIKSCQIRVLLRHAEKNDLDMCEKMVGSVATREDLETFSKGTGVIFGFTDKPMIVHFDKKQSTDESETPGLDRLRNRQRPVSAQQRLPKVVMEPMLAKSIQTGASNKATLDLDTVLAIMEKHGDKLTDKAVQALFDRLPDADKESQEDSASEIPMEEVPRTHAESVRTEPSRIGQRHQKAVNAWNNEGYDSIRKLMPVMGLNFNQTRDLVDTLHHKGLIDKHNKSRKSGEKNV